MWRILAHTYRRQYILQLFRLHHAQIHLVLILVHRRILLLLPHHGQINSRHHFLLPTPIQLKLTTTHYPTPKLKPPPLPPTRCLLPSMLQPLISSLFPLLPKLTLLASLQSPTCHHLPTLLFSLSAELALFLPLQLRLSPFNIFSCLSATFQTLSICQLQPGFHLLHRLHSSSKTLSSPLARPLRFSIRTPSTHSWPQLFMCSLKPTCRIRSFSSSLIYHRGSNCTFGTSLNSANMTSYCSGHSSATFFMLGYSAVATLRLTTQPTPSALILPTILLPYLNQSDPLSRLPRLTVSLHLIHCRQIPTPLRSRLQLQFLQQNQLLLLDPILHLPFTKLFAFQDYLQQYRHLN